MNNSPYLDRPHMPLQEALDASNARAARENFAALVASFRAALAVDEAAISADAFDDYYADRPRPAQEPATEPSEAAANERIAEARAELLGRHKEAIASDIKSWLDGLTDACVGDDFRTLGEELAEIATRVRALGVALAQVNREAR